MDQFYFYHVFSLTMYSDWLLDYKTWAIGTPVARREVDFYVWWFVDGNPKLYQINQVYFDRIPKTTINFNLLMVLRGNQIWSESSLTSSGEIEEALTNMALENDHFDGKKIRYMKEETGNVPPRLDSHQCAYLRVFTVNTLRIAIISTPWFTTSFPSRTILNFHDCWLNHGFGLWNSHLCW